MTTPVQFWGLDPLFHVPMQLLIFQLEDLKAVPDHDGVFLHHTHPIRSVETMGFVQSMHRSNKRILYNLGDSTSRFVIQCIMWIDQSTPPVQETRPRHDPSPLQDYEVGQLIKVTGQISKFKETTQIIFQPGDSVVCDDPNDETMFRLTVMDLEYSVYSKPVVLPESIVREMNKKPMTEETLMDRIREWISTRDEFEYFELEDDEENDRIALEIVRSKVPTIHPVHATSQATKLMTRCLQQLVYAGSLEVIEGQLAFRVIKDPVTLRKRRSSRENSGDHDVLQLVMAHEISSGEDSDSGWDSDLGEVKLEVKVEELDHEVQVKEEEQEQELEQEEQEEEQKERPTRGKKRKQEEEE